MGKPKKSVSKADACKQRTLMTFYKKTSTEVHQSIPSAPAQPANLYTSDKSSSTNTVCLKKIKAFYILKMLYLVQVAVINEAIQAERNNYRNKYIQTKKCLTKVVQTSAAKDIIIKQKEEQIKTLLEQVSFLKSNKKQTLTFTDASCFDETQLQCLMSTPGDGPSDNKFARALVRFLFSTWEDIPTQSLLKNDRPLLLTTMQRMIIERIAYHSKDLPEFADRSNKSRVSKIISSAMYIVKRTTNENDDEAI